MTAVPSDVISFQTNPPSLFDPSGVATYNVYSSYAASLPADTNAGNAGAGLTVQQEFQIVNYVLNFPKGKSGVIATTVTDEQAVIWQLLNPADSTLTLSGTDAAATALYQDALANGRGFIPGAGQVVAIILDPQTPAASPLTFQGVIITVPLSGAITIVKSANVSIANCFQKVTYTYVVTNTGSVTLNNIGITDDNGTPNYDKDDFIAGTLASLAPGKSATFTQSIYLPISEYAVDSSGNSNWSTLIPKCLPNGDIEITFLEDDDLKDNTYGSKSSAGWKTQGGKGFWDNMGTDYAEFQLVDGSGNTVLDFDADYVSVANYYPSGFGTTGIHNGWSGWHSGNAANLSGVTTTMSDNMNKASKFYGATTNSPDPDRDWERKCAYKVAVHPAAFGWAGFGGCKIKNVQNSRCKTGGGHYAPQPVCGVVTNIARVSATAAGTTSKTVTAVASASVTLNAPCQPACQQNVHKCQHQQQQCQCTCYACQHGDHGGCQNSKCQDAKCAQQNCPWSNQKCR